MIPVAEDTELKQQAIAYVTELYRELSEENGAPTLGTQNQAVDFILAEPARREALARWGKTVDTAEATTAPPRRLPYDDLYFAVRDCLGRIMEKPVFERGGP
ncbi:MAG TPA: hypothetical protein VFA12_15225 [Stellaceae bacterium]|nr:hypothetical protein [Stellaceae bacterium]